MGTPHRADTSIYAVLACIWCKLTSHLCRSKSVTVTARHACSCRGRRMSTVRPVERTASTLLLHGTRYACRCACTHAVLKVRSLPLTFLYLVPLLNAVEVTALWREAGTTHIGSVGYTTTCGKRAVRRCACPMRTVRRREHECKHYCSPFVSLLAPFAAVGALQQGTTAVFVLCQPRTWPIEIVFLTAPKRHAVAPYQHVILDKDSPDVPDTNVREPLMHAGTTNLLHKRQEARLLQKAPFLPLAPACLLACCAVASSCPSSSSTTSICTCSPHINPTTRVLYVPRMDLGTYLAGYDEAPQQLVAGLWACEKVLKALEPELLCSVIAVLLERLGKCVSVK